LGNKLFFDPTFSIESEKYFRNLRNNKEQTTFLLSINVYYAIFFHMPRRSRAIVPNIPLHIIKRGNNRQPCFFAEEDY